MLATIAIYALVIIVIGSAVIFGMLQILRLIGLTRAALARELLLDRGADNRGSDRVRDAGSYVRETDSPTRVRRGMVII